MALIPLGGKVAAGRSALVDERFADELRKHRWHCDSDGYARHDIYCGMQDGKQKARHVYIHNEVWRLAGRTIPAGQELDHINGDPLDNRIENLRVVTHQQNSCNRKSQCGSSRYKGACWHKAKGKWHASIMHNGKRIHLGYFANEIEAAKAYDTAARRLFGEYARCNFREGDDDENIVDSVEA